MLVDVKKLNSHPNKTLFTHVGGVINNVKKLTRGLEVAKWTELVAIFHDLGKINPNFQSKLDKTKVVQGYANHAYFSAYAFYCCFMHVPANHKLLKIWLGVDRLSANEIIALTVIIAKHHGHLLDFKPESKEGDEPTILNLKEVDHLFLFLKEKGEELPILEFSQFYIDKLEDFKFSLLHQKANNDFKKRFLFTGHLSDKSLDFFLDTQFAFASLIYADKSDAANFPTIEDSKREVNEFCDLYGKRLDNFLDTLKPDSDLNKLRTRIRKESVATLEGHLKEGKRIFELTSPTGSGKTLMLMSLAAKIIEEKGEYRMIYSLPFLSITEQVEAEVLKIFKGYEKYIQRVDSKSKNHRFENIQRQLDDNPDESIVRELGAITFQENVFAYPFIITTFVRFFETLLSNHNATLLKLPNFSKCIFLIDEIQSLPPRLYTFFVAYLDKFCEKFDSYAVISTATQPNFNLPNKGTTAKDAKIFFSNYQCPAKLLEHEKYFSDDVFNRYKIDFIKKDFDLKELKKRVLEENQSVLVILNTIDDSKDFYELLNEELLKDELILLNTHFTPNDRKYKIDFIKMRLRYGKKIIVISTQLIEAGVDIDFPVLYRDFALVSSIVQAAGRCNRNGKLDFGKVVLFKLRNHNKLRSELIYGRGKDKDILQYTKDAWLQEMYEEKELLVVQKNFFDRILNDLNFAEHSQNKFNLEFDFLKDISDCMFQKIGKFQLIDEQDYGEPFRYYIAKSERDNSFQILQKKQNQLLELLQNGKKDWSKITPLKSSIENQLKDMAGNIVQVRLKTKDSRPETNSEECLGIFELHPIFYSERKGVIINGIVGII